MNANYIKLKNILFCKKKNQEIWILKFSIHLKNINIRTTMLLAYAHSALSFPSKN